jgi:predicted AAA+ superfamily ATPase
MLALVNNLAVRASQLLNLSALGNTIGVDAKSIERWLGLLERLFLITRVPAWHSNALKRLVRAPKVQFFDSGLVAALQNIDHAKLERDRQLFGPLLETFVFGELRKAASLTARHTSISHYRDKDQVEVDFVLERSPGHLIGIEVKASATIRPADIRGLTKIRDAALDQFKLGVVLHDGDCVQEVSERIFTAPVSILWS